MSQNPAAKSHTLRSLTEEFCAQEGALREGGGPAGRERQRRLGRLTARERVARLLDARAEFLELGLWAAYQMYPEAGDVPAAGVVAGIGPVCDRQCMIVANDATVKAGAFFPQTVKKLLRAQRIAFECALPVLYLVDSAGVYLPMQDEIFPDEDDFGRIFRNNAVLSAAGIPQYAAIMGNCIAGGAYLPVLCDKLLMTEGSGLYLAGPALVKAAIGQASDPEELGGARMHAAVSGTIDFREPDDEACLARLRTLVDLLLPDSPASDRHSATPPEFEPESVYNVVSADGRKEYDVRDLLACIVDSGSMQEYKAEYGQTLVAVFARLGGHAVGIVANQRKRCESAAEGIQIGGVLYADSADKAARFVMDCNQTGLPIVFFQDVVGFMVGRTAEQSGIIKNGAKLVNAVSNSIVPKITIVVGNSFGAGNYALCGKAYDPRFIFAWPNARYAVMGADQASQTIFDIQKRAAGRSTKESNNDDLEQLRERVKADYQEQMDIRYGAARGWVDAIIAPDKTRDVLINVLNLVKRKRPEARFHTGVLQV
ncbi:MAG: acyl-CoA carboxylase subunit beta [Candidatus Hydrogenedentes bacterium]|nr:acyl-CoA carboxylase subunit beta [Candidatus Hydrogenedentota bacterium]